ncbi:hypothetical protein [Flavobacterium kingsejongi]|uniref:Secretion system C-terminal sorting domain-containing protein n=1 Tax=Flavobacterium kingsejongi TaxID=1678728 RepID=A0A2S1LP70_9FLAO|nr:hypothetical protein [Flavobacterium kingsejongi]AWG25498.1 hypothetical protein FK004_09740 [Flavobacterium kingsejongi]
MKNVMKFGLVLAMSVLSFGAHANEADILLKVKSETGKMVSFSINEVKSVHLSLYSTKNDLLFEETIFGKNNTNRKYDLTAFPNGTYFLEAETGSKVARYEIQVRNKTATISEKAVAEIAKPTLLNKDGMVTVTIPNTERTPVEIKVYDQNNVELYNETMTGKQELTKKFDVKNSALGKLTFVMKYKNEMFVETIAAR